MQTYRQQGKKSFPVWDTAWIMSYHPILPPKTVNGLSTTPLGRVPVTIQLGQAQYEDGLHIIQVYDNCEIVTNQMGAEAL